MHWSLGWRRSGWFSIAYIDRIIFVEGNGQSEIVSSVYTGEKINEKDRKKENKQLKSTD